MNKVGASKGRHGFTLESLSQKWLISLEADSKTAQYTTQLGIRKIVHPSLSQRFKTNDRALRCDRLQYSG